MMLNLRTNRNVTILWKQKHKFIAFNFTKWIYIEFFLWIFNWKTEKKGKKKTVLHFVWDKKKDNDAELCSTHLEWVKSFSHIAVSSVR